MEIIKTKIKKKIGFLKAEQSQLTEYRDAWPVKSYGYALRNFRVELWGFKISLWEALV